ncbi:hypothetical protein GCM10009677_10440 [Sphaerisporangium rubeum]|uniref:DUF397 domain-containing protein n=1 Tax=Sphaerisporangium rubeum TaxID=321317 RepID=UPI0016110EA4|nr:DUF397 domain-containing protein [Sphaerisporangium rubeum]
MASDLRNAQWRKSSFSGDSGECVEVASDLSGFHFLRDSKNLTGPSLAVPSKEWSIFVNQVKATGLR